MSAHRALKFIVDRRYYNQGYGIFICGKPINGKMSVATGLMMKEIDEGSYCDDDAPIKVTPAEAQQLLDELWRIGLRPSMEVGSEGERTALKEHIKDLRDVVTRLFNARTTWTDMSPPTS